MSLATRTENHHCKLAPRSRNLTRALLLISTVTGSTLTATASSPGYQDVQIEECPNKLNLTAQYWKENRLDDYLKNYPKGTFLTLPEYVQQLPTPIPFECGVDKTCKVPSICHPVRGADWYILYATSHWNSYANSLIHALRASARLAESVVPQLLRDFVRDYDPATTAGEISEGDLVRLLLSPIQPGGIATNSGGTSSQSRNWDEAIETLNDESSGHGPNLTHEQAADSHDQSGPQNADDENTHDEDNHSDERGSDKHQWQDGRHMRYKREEQPNSSDESPITINSNKSVEDNLKQLSAEFEAMWTESLNSKVITPISLEEGIYGSLKGGRFLEEGIMPAALARKARKIVQLITISALLKHQNAIVLVTKSDCHKHRDEEQDGNDTLAFCASDGTLIQILKVTKNGKLVKQIYNGHLIQEKYGYSTPFLASEAWSCFYGVSGDSEAKELDPNSEGDQLGYCPFNLPVCDLTETDHRKNLKHGKKMPQICRDAGFDV